MKNEGVLDYLIVGQGVAGSAVALNLLKRGKSIVVFDEPSKNRASKVAAGLFNPVTGQYNARTWMANELFDYLHQFYREAEFTTGKKFFFPSIIYRPFGNISEQNDLMGKSAEEKYVPFIDKLATTSAFEKEVNDPFGGIFLKCGGFVNTISYMTAVREHLLKQDAFREEFFDTESISVQQDFVQYKDFKASKIIFCQGERSGLNKFFKTLPIKPLKGETLTIKTSWNKDVILNRGVYMVPEIQSGKFRVGATYKFNDTTPLVSESGRQELEEKLRALISLPFEVEGEDWGMRPTTNDRRPLIGHHPETERLTIFNGLGTKGISLAPYFSEVLIHWLENTGTLPKDVALTRFK